MADQSIEALMGLMPPDSSDQQLLADQLRGQQKMGDFYSLSPTLSGYGQGKSKRALTVADKAGDRRQQGLTRTRQAKEDARKQAERDQKLLGYTDIKQYNNPESGKIETWGVSKKTGQPEQIDDMTGMTEYSDPSKGKNTWARKLSTGEEVLAHRDGSVTIPGYGKFQTLKEAEADSLERMGVGKRNLAKEGQRGTDEAKEIQTNLDGFAESSAAFSGAIGAYDQIVASIDDGAASGIISEWFPTLTNPTALLESTMAGLTLESLKRHKLTPVSDKDIEYVKRSAAPRLRPQALRKWAMHKKEATERMLKANAVMEEWYRENEGVPTGQNKKMLEKAVDEILHSENFEFAFTLDEEDKLEGEGEKVEVEAFTRPSWILADDPRWDKLTKAEQQQVIAARAE